MEAVMTVMEVAAVHCKPRREAMVRKALVRKRAAREMAAAEMRACAHAADMHTSSHTAGTHSTSHAAAVHSAAMPTTTMPTAAMPTAFEGECWRRESKRGAKCAYHEAIKELVLHPNFLVWGFFCQGVRQSGKSFVLRQFLCRFLKSPLPTVWNGAHPSKRDPF
jgi:hypothetical protein